MLRACSSSCAMDASSGSVGVAKFRKTVPPHLLQVTAFGTAWSKNFSLPQVRHTSVTRPRGPLSFAMAHSRWARERPLQDACGTRRFSELNLVQFIPRARSGVDSPGDSAQGILDAGVLQRREG